MKHIRPVIACRRVVWDVIRMGDALYYISRNTLKCKNNNVYNNYYYYKWENFNWSRSWVRSLCSLAWEVNRGGGKKSNNINEKIWNARRLNEMSKRQIFKGICIHYVHNRECKSMEWTRKWNVWKRNRRGENDEEEEKKKETVIVLISKWRNGYKKKEKTKDAAFFRSRSVLFFCC